MLWVCFSSLTFTFYSTKFGSFRPALESPPCFPPGVLHDTHILFRHSINSSPPVDRLRGLLWLRWVFVNRIAAAAKRSSHIVVKRIDDWYVYQSKQLEIMLDNVPESAESSVDIAQNENLGSRRFLLSALTRGGQTSRLSQYKLGPDRRISLAISS